jgi:hypothetical protein
MIPAVRAGLVVAFCLLTVSRAHNADLSVAEQTIELILNAPPEANAVWPGFSLPQRNWLIYDAAGAYLVTTETPPPSFERRGRWYYHAGKLAGLNGTLNLEYSAGSVIATAVPVGQSAEQTAVTLYHEAFHAFQHERFATLANPPGQPRLRPQDVTPEVAASIEVERRALRDAIRSNGVDQTTIRMAVAVRAQRVAGSSGATTGDARRAEQREGTAQYVGDYSIALARRRSARTVADRLARQLAIPMREVSGSPEEVVVRVPAYGTGAAMGILLDRLGADWKSEAQKNAIDLLLAKHVSVTAEAVPRLAAEAHRRYGYDAMLASKDPPWGDLRVFGEDDFNALAPYRLVLEFTETVTTGFNFSSKGWPSGAHRPSPGVLILPLADRFTAEAKRLSVVVTRRPVRFEVGRPGTITILLSGAPRVNGAEVRSGFEATLLVTRIEADGALVTVTRPARVIATAQSLRVVP